MINLLLIILGFGILIFVHEAGHFLAAKWARIRTEVFAIGMGTAVLSWRKGIGVVWGSSHARVVAKTGKEPRQLSDEELARHGIGETEYSLRWLPIGGFVKMLGQDDTDPEYVSNQPRSYNVCPIGYGNLVIIGHGEDYHSLYGHLDKMHVRVGSIVDTGEVIGNSGDTGSLVGETLYFEIRHKGKPVEPTRWFRVAKK